MKLFADMRKWIGGALKKIYFADLSMDSLSAMQQAAIERNRLANEENRAAAKHASEAVNELLAAMEARNRGTN